MDIAHLSPHFEDILGSSLQHANVNLLNTPGLTLTYNARAAIYLGLSMLPNSNRTEVLVPAFHCPSGITPVIQAGYTPVFFRVNRDLSVDLEDLLSKIHARTAAVMVINYFGFQNKIDEIIEAKNKHKFFIIEDCSHSFLAGPSFSLAGQRGDMAVYSFWKGVPSLVGGGLWMSSDTVFNAVKLKNVPIRDSIKLAAQIFDASVHNMPGGVVRSSILAMDRLRVSLKNGNKMKSHNNTTGSVESGTSEADAAYPFHKRLAQAKMPYLAKRIIMRGNLATIWSARRKNYHIFSSSLSDKNGMKNNWRNLSETTCPWVYPVLLEDRDRIDQSLKAQGVGLHTFGSMLHPALLQSTDDAAIEDAQFLSKNLLCLSIHQQISQERVHESCKIINRFIENKC